MHIYQNNSLKIYQPSELFPWNEKRIQYVFRRLSYGISYKKIEKIKQEKPQQVIQGLINQAKSGKKIAAPHWANWEEDKYFRGEQTKDKVVEKCYTEWRATVAQQMHKGGLREKMILFWNNHFVTGFWEHENPSSLYRYYKVLEKYAFGNFKTFVYKIGLTPAMLYYLNGEDNTKKKPNENYARELLELFTLGRDNQYTQQDIREIARAMSGYYAKEGLKAAFSKDDHDTGVKTIFGQKGNFDYKGVIDVLFQERQQEIAHHICTKIYAAFVHLIPNNETIKQLAATFIKNDFELLPVYRQLFTSEHFLSDEFIGTQIKSPYDLCLGFIGELDIRLTEIGHFKDIVEGCDWMGQWLFDPPNVAGWPGQRAWIDVTTLTRRWSIMDDIVSEMADNKVMGKALIAFAKKVSNHSKEVEEITKAIVDYFLPKPLQNEEIYAKAVQKFKEEWEEEDFSSGWWNLDREDVKWQIANLLSYIFRLPDFHLA